MRNREKILERAKKSRENGSNRKSVDKYRKNNPEKVSMFMKIFKKNNPDYFKKHRENNIEKYRLMCKNYRARRNKADGKITIEQWEDLKVNIIIVV